MKISVITVAYKSPEILEKSIESFFKYNDMGDDIEYIIVDNSPINERVNKRLSKDILNKIIYIPADNQGFGAGNNAGAMKAKGEILAFINPDIIFIEPIFSKIYERFETNKNIGIMGCKLLYEDLTPGFSFYFDYKYSAIKKWTLKLWNTLNYFDSKNMYIAGADLFVRKDVFFDSGMFDENIFMYYEEPDLTRRMKNVGDWKVFFDNNLRMIHLEKKSTPNTLISVKYEFESAIYYGKKYNLDFKKKVSFEYKYLILKKYIYKLIHNKKYNSTKKICDYLHEQYFKEGNL